ncbi:hypothetical protein FN846DRAFT_911969 [Sphaerosporella brunnea]|uniref:Uncharacterized protein n=1 Tax=Sphaerosporella brunnea TaxID=1250544 RepID=A0A5J5EIJ8_9PEZI|nr:hypothetical protein FN846DRAFT_911969 [Sphaerosporella brunnea]
MSPAQPQIDAKSQALLYSWIWKHGSPIKLAAKNYVWQCNYCDFITARYNGLLLSAHLLKQHRIVEPTHINVNYWIYKHGEKVVKDGEYWWRCDTCAETFPRGHQGGIARHLCVEHAIHNHLDASASRRGKLQNPKKYKCDCCSKDSEQAAPLENMVVPPHSRSCVDKPYNPSEIPTPRTRHIDNVLTQLPSIPQLDPTKKRLFSPMEKQPAWEPDTSILQRLGTQLQPVLAHALAAPSSPGGPIDAAGLRVSPISRTASPLSTGFQTPATSVYSVPGRENFAFQQSARMHACTLTPSPSSSPVASLRGGASQLSSREGSGVVKHGTHTTTISTWGASASRTAAAASGGFQPRDSSDESTREEEYVSVLKRFSQMHARAQASAPPVAFEGGSKKSSNSVEVKEGAASANAATFGTATTDFTGFQLRAPSALSVPGMDYFQISRGFEGMSFSGQNTQFSPMQPAEQITPTAFSPPSAPLHTAVPEADAAAAAPLDDPYNLELIDAWMNIPFGMELDWEI